jgi:repressor of nif and glnA expression
MGRLITLYGPGEAAGELLVPDGQVGIGTVCSITVNGALLAHGIPTFSRFGGLIEIEDRKPTRFVAIINYDGTSLDPLEIFIKSGMTDYLGATENGNGRIGASFREIPAASRQRVMELAGKLTEVGLGGFMEIGMPGQPLMEIPIEESRIGAVVIGGLNPVAILSPDWRTSSASSTSRSWRPG